MGGGLGGGEGPSRGSGRRLADRDAAEIRRDTQAGGAGNYVVLRNLGTNTRFAYMHLQEPSPRREGDRLGAGQVVGQVGNTGRSFGCHLHFEYWVGQWWTGGKPIDPFPYLRSLLRK